MSDRLDFQIVFDTLIQKKYDLFISNEILLEYEEKINQFFNKTVVNNTLKLFNILPNIYKTDIYYNLNLITPDPNDNKFVDCAFACNADYIITNDKHFDLLQNIEYPKIKIISIENFVNLLS